MRYVCDKDMCTGCMACVDVCARKAVSIKDSIYAYNAVIDENICINCNLCRKVCQNNHHVEMTKPIAWYQGWSFDESVRIKSSSGGAATSLAKAFIKMGGIVCSCTFNEGEFIFEFAENEKEINKFRGSKYVKSNPLGVYEVIKKNLIDGKNVLFIGLPCQVAAVKQYVGNKLLKSLYTIDLICHGSPSPQLLEMFFNEYKMSLNDIKAINFRKKTRFKIFNDYKKIVSDRIQDTYTYAFLSSLDYTENCYSCKYAQIERTSDITIGDSWQSNLSNEEKQKGISLLLLQTDKGIQLLSNSDMHLEDVDIDLAISSNHQLSAPSTKHKKRALFFKLINTGVSFNKAISKCCPEMYYKQKLKALLISLKILKSGGYE